MMSFKSMNPVQRLFNSIQGSLFTRLIVVFLLTELAILVLTAYWLRNRIIDTNADVWEQHFHYYGEYIIRDIGSPPDLDQARKITERVPVDISITGKDVNWQSVTPFHDIGQLEFVELSVEGAYFARDPGRRFVVKVEYDGYSIILADRSMTGSHAHDQTIWLIVISIAFCLVVCYFVVRWIFRPIRWVRAGARRIGHGDFSFRIANNRHDELGELTEDINQMAGDLEKIMAAKHQLLLAISHELRSPLTRTKVALEFVEDQSVRDNIAADVREMEALVSDLLESEKLNTRHQQLNKAVCEINEMVRCCIDEYFPLASDDSEQKVQLETLEKPMSLDVDITRLRLLLKNLVDNAICHTQASAWPVIVRLSQQDDELLLQVVDQGAGIAAEHIPFITDPFYRADSSRQRKTGGYGLGLHLCKLIAEAHGGHLHIDSEIGQGTTVTAALPV